MKNSIIILSIVLISCSVNNPKYIHGYVYDKKGSPVKGLRIEAPYDQYKYSFTDDRGYFKMELISSRFLYVKMKNIKIDSIYYLRTHPERGVSYYFVEGRSDTLFIDISKYGK